LTFGVETFCRIIYLRRMKSVHAASKGRVLARLHRLRLAAPASKQGYQVFLAEPWNI
jgi:hypothetical protein